SAAAVAASSKEARELRLLENRLDKATAKANEAQSIRKMYEQVLDRMRQEALGFNAQVQALEVSLADKRLELDEAHDAQRLAQRSKEAAKQD
ncbi:uncharacterized protein HaLaN_28253, partial [Haematococcus lacustris]